MTSGKAERFACCVHRHISRACHKGGPQKMLANEGSPVLKHKDGNGKCDCVPGTGTASLCASAFPFRGPTLHFSLTVRTPPSAVLHVVGGLLLRRGARLRVCKAHRHRPVTALGFSLTRALHTLSVQEEATEPLLSHSGRNCQPRLLPRAAGHTQ